MSNISGAPPKTATSARAEALNRQAGELSWYLNLGANAIRSRGKKPPKRKLDLQMVAKNAPKTEKAKAPKTKAVPVVPGRGKVV